MKANFHSFSLGKGFKRLIQVVLVAAFLLPIIVVAQTPVVNETQKLLAGDGLQSDWFGYAVGISGDNAVIGAYGDDGIAIQSGSAYVFERQPDDNTWLQMIELTAADAAAGDNFGHAVSVSGNVALIGAYTRYDVSNGASSGAAYVFTRQPDGQWLQTARLQASDGWISDWFAYEVALSDGTAVMGAPNVDASGLNSGAAYVFEYNAGSDIWAEKQRLVPDDGEELDGFGWEVAIHNDLIVVGSIFGDGNSEDSGAAYIFEHQLDGTWLQTAKLYASDGELRTISITLPSSTM